MDSLPSYSKISLTQFPPHQFKNTLLISSSTLFSPFNFQTRKSLAVVASSCCSNNNGSGNWEFSGLTMPLLPRTETGRSLSSMLHRGRSQNDKKEFYGLVKKELVDLAYVRSDAILRSFFSLCSDEAVLHRRISEMTKLECRNAVEDVMYMLIGYKFSEIGVHLVPKLSNCMYNGRLEIWPCKDWELESIHSVEVLEMVKEIGWKYKSNMKDNWALTQVQKLQIRHVYAASVLYGYFLKSASLRYNLEQSFDKTPSSLLFSRSWLLKQKTVSLGRVSDTRPMSVGRVSLLQGKKQDNLRSYVMSLDDEIKHMIAKPKFKETKSLIKKHCSALFGDDDSHDEYVSTSLASLNRFVLEAVAFGSFLWDAEDYVRTFYQLEEN
ncbi:hypothetical protein HAX54_052918 [Datura stramonium]|uniref:Uncharacterized protein n=1 Tax=Datura stramonium TaxID=4076 RepID=A0ABS8WR41_DATST|nr:hypothetical protein [Datura stramonium]